MRNFKTCLIDSTAGNRGESTVKKNTLQVGKLLKEIYEEQQTIILNHFDIINLKRWVVWEKEAWLEIHNF